MEGLAQSLYIEQSVDWMIDETRDLGCFQVIEDKLLVINESINRRH